MSQRTVVPSKRQINAGAWIAGVALTVAFLAVWFGLRALTTDAVAVAGTLAACIAAAAAWPKITNLVINLLASLTTPTNTTRGPHIPA